MDLSKQKQFKDAAQHLFVYITTASRDPNIYNQYSISLVLVKYFGLIWNWLSLAIDFTQSIVLTFVNMNHI